MMVLRPIANATVHGIAGAVLGITTALAACTVAQCAQQALKKRVREDNHRDLGVSDDR